MVNDPDVPAIHLRGVRASNGRTIDLSAVTASQRTRRGVCVPLIEPGYDSTDCGHQFWTPVDGRCPTPIDPDHR
jgi:hypothetical protein